MRIAIISAIDNGVGLERDCRIIAALCDAAGHDVTLVHHRKAPPKGATFDLAIFVEVYDAKFAALAPVRWLIPNPEWWVDEWTAALPTFDRVLCKTRDAERIFAGLGARAVFTGFAAQDRRDLSIPRSREFLHVAGESLLKGTAEVIEAWERFDLPFPLTIVARKFKVRLKSPASNRITVKTRVSDAELRTLQNRCLFHVQPSRYEGFGHIIHESMSVGAVILTTMAPPMNEWGLPFMSRPDRYERHGLAECAVVSADGIAYIVRQEMATTSDVWNARESQHVRAEYDRETAAFAVSFTDELASAGKAHTVHGIEWYDIPGNDVEVVTRKLTSTWSIPDPPTPRIAICFPAHASNAPVMLRSIQALRAQTCDPSLFEVCVGVDGWTGDGVPFEWAPQLDTAFHLSFAMSTRPRGDVPHRNHARNAAWRAARAPLVMILDADFMLPAHAIEHVLAEHDAELARGCPAVFSLCLASVEGGGPDEWLRRSAEWAVSGDPALFDALTHAHPPNHDAYSGYADRYTGDAAPHSVPLNDLLEGMPVLWRGILEAMGGFDESFGEWGGDKEELIDRIKGCARAGLFEIRLMTSVLALHQPHVKDSSVPKVMSKPAPDVKARWKERERRASLIKRNDLKWWAPQLARVSEAMPAILSTAVTDIQDHSRAADIARGITHRNGGPSGASPGSPSTAPAAPLFDVGWMSRVNARHGIDGESLSAPRPHVAALAHEVARHFQGKSHRSSVMSVVVAGHRFAPDVVAALTGIGMNVRGYSVADVLAAPAKSLPWIVAIDMLSSAADDAAFAAMGDTLRRVVGPRGYVCLVERCRSGGHPVTRKYRPPLDFQRAITGIGPVGAPFAIDGEWFTVFTGRVVR